MDNIDILTAYINKQEKPQEFLQRIIHMLTIGKPLPDNLTNGKKEG